MWQSLVAVAGTLAGVLLTSLIQRTERTAATREARRREALTAVSDLGTALADHRQAMWAREDLRLKGGNWAEARAASHTTRSAITAPSVRVALLLPALTAAADTAARATYDMRHAPDQAALETARTKALTAATQFTIEAGRLLAA
ncbi:protein kilB [Streptomyces sp. NPDC052052]|uniref:protein kilB n=1 Tax=Streptomyces sp. NPDC052052 TaxID=3154756 RepID=UPI00342FC7A9